MAGEERETQGKSREGSASEDQAIGKVQHGPDSAPEDFAVCFIHSRGKSPKAQNVWKNGEAGDWMEFPGVVCGSSLRIKGAIWGRTCRAREY